MTNFQISPEEQIIIRDALRVHRLGLRRRAGRAKWDGISAETIYRDKIKRVERLLDVFEENKATNNDSANTEKGIR